MVWTEVPGDRHVTAGVAASLAVRTLLCYYQWVTTTAHDSSTGPQQQDTTALLSHNSGGHDNSSVCFPMLGSSAHNNGSKQRPHQCAHNNGSKQRTHQCAGGQDCHAGCTVATTGMMPIRSTPHTKHPSAELSCRLHCRDHRKHVARIMHS